MPPGECKRRKFDGWAAIFLKDAAFLFFIKQIK